MNIKKFGAMLTALCLGASLLTGCIGVPKNRVFSTDDLPGKSIGVQAGTTGEDMAKKLEEHPAQGKPAAKVIGYDKGADAINALLSGDIDCVIIDNEPAKLFILENEKLQILPDIFVNEYYAIAVSKDRPELTKELNKAMDALISEGVIDKILANYIGDNQGSYQYTTPENVDRSKGKLTMVTTWDFAPYVWRSDNGSPVGIDVDIFRALCDKLGYEPEIADIKFEEIFNAVQNGEYDVGMGALTITDERMADVDFTESYAQGVQVIVTRKQ